MPENNKINRNPKSRKYDLGSGALPPQITRSEYVELFLGSKLKSREKNALLYLSHRYNFKEARATSMSVRRAANDLDWNTSTFRSAKRELLRLGWISVKKSSFQQTDKITLLIGHEIPELKWKEPIHKETQLEYEAEGLEE